MKGNGAPRLLPKRRAAGLFLNGWGAAVRDGVLTCLAGFLLSGAQAAGRLLPLAACLPAALPLSFRSLFAAAGAATGYLLFGKGAACAELVAMTVLMLVSAAVFQGTELPARKWFFPAVSGGVAAVLGAVFLFSAPGSSELYAWGLKTAAASFGTLALRSAMQGDHRGKLFFAAALLAGLSGLPLPVNAGLLGASALTLCAPELTAVTVFGLALDLRGGSCACAALLLPTAVWRMTGLRSSLLRAGTGILLTGAATILCGAGNGANLLGIVLGYMAGWLLLRTGLSNLSFAATAKERAAGCLEEAAEVLDALRSQMDANGQTQPVQSEADGVYDGAADRVCRCCPKFRRCWEYAAQDTYYALTGAAKTVLERGVAEPEDFPESFRENCCHLDGFLTAVNQELEGMLYRRRYRVQMHEAQQVILQEFSCIAEFLRERQGQLHEQAHGRRAYVPVTGISTARKRGNFSNGDRGVCFAGPGSEYYILLSDGMGSGREAASLSSETVHFLKKLLYAGMRPGDALQVLNGAFLLRGNGCFATVDLVDVNLESGDAELLKWGGPPSYLRRKDQSVQKMGAAALPPGVGVGETHAPERYKLSLRDGEMLILLSDGAGGEETEGIIAGYSGESPRELAALLIAEASASDDMTAVALSLRPYVC